MVAKTMSTYSILSLFFPRKGAKLSSLSHTTADSEHSRHELKKLHGHKTLSFKFRLKALCSSMSKRSFVCLLFAAGAGSRYSR
eukprot:scaffold4493_cov390-Prasinococcus_capsulatus_cf.AAC.14